MSAADAGQGVAGRIATSCLLREGDVVVRPLAPADAEPLYRAVRSSLESLSYWLPWCRHNYALTDATAWVEHSLACWAAGSEFPLGVFDAAGALIGGTGVSRIDRAHGVGNLGYWVCDGARNRGVATRAARAAARLGFDVLGLTRLEIVVLPHNTASQRVAEKLGALREVEARNRVLFHGRPERAVVYSLIPDDLVDG
ncbi:MAG: GNAT family N-acetyltransferase [Rhodanobacter sp.]|uniref:GNAT family N-acetyltransferase n=1 Tax=Rhodanobacter sp. KK11 TaxID=3083255 RepID=UPI002966E675|nr:GNAT family N-acetyltransferase [Rhodanobacter sp. KK11]MDW2981174.1 GNAT family N-acetyltransferase [Rhodanobacter sp. KK11]